MLKQRCMNDPNDPNNRKLRRRLTVGMVYFTCSRHFQIILKKQSNQRVNLLLILLNFFSLSDLVSTTLLIDDDDVLSK